MKKPTDSLRLGQKAIKWYKMERLKDKVWKLTSVWKNGWYYTLLSSPFLSFKTTAIFFPLVHMKGQLMVTPQGSEAKEDKTKTKRKKRKLCMAMQAKTGSLIEDSSWSVSHRGWAGLACSDFTPMNANINGGLLSDLMLRTSLGSEGVGGWEEERRRTRGYRWWLYLF